MSMTTEQKIEMLEGMPVRKLKPPPAVEVVPGEPREPERPDPATITPEEAATLFEPLALKFVRPGGTPLFECVRALYEIREGLPCERPPGFGAVVSGPLGKLRRMRQRVRWERAERLAKMEARESKGSQPKPEKPKPYSYAARKGNLDKN